MKTIKELREDIQTKISRLDEIANLAEGENRDFTEAEDQEREQLMTDVETIKKRIDLLEKEERIRKENALAAGVPVQTESREETTAKRDYNWGKAVSGVLNRDLLEGLEREMHDEGVKEMKAIGKAADPRSIVIPSMMLQKRAVITENTTTGIEKMGWIDHLYANTVLREAGADFLTGITDMRFPVLGEVQATWEGETDNAADGGNASSKVDLTPNRLATYVDYSKMADLQHSGTLSAAIQRATAVAVAAKLEKAVFTDETSAGAPTDIKDSKTAVSASDIAKLAAALVEEVAGNSGLFGNLAYIWSTDLISEVFTAAGVSGVNPLYINGLVNGYKTLWSSQLEVITASTPVVYFGDWSQLKIAQFGGIEIMVDPYTQAIGGKNRIHLNSYWDFKETKGAKISVGEIAETT